MIQAQQFLPVEWQRDSTAYANNLWVRDTNGNRIDDFIEMKSGQTIDIVVDLNQFVERGTLLSTYQQYVTTGDTGSIYINNYIPFIFVPDVSADTVATSIITQPEVFMVEYAGGFKGELDITTASMGLRGRPFTVQQIFKNSSGLDLTGNGVGIIILDSGVGDIGHQAFISSMGQVWPSWGMDFSTSLSGIFGNPTPYNQHATVMATVAFGRGTSMGNQNKGVASCGFIAGIPGAYWGDIKALDHIINRDDAFPSSRFNYVVAALDYVIMLAQTQPIRIVNMSFTQFDHLDMAGNPQPLIGNGTEAFSQLVNYAVAQGLVCVASAGNYNTLGPGRITTPGAAFGAITVGASVTNGDTLRDNHRIASFSSVGPLASSSYHWKPDLTAPGLHMETPLVNGLMIPPLAGISYQENDVYGTSIAAAHISGLAALMLEYICLTPACLKDALMQSAQRFTDPAVIPYYPLFADATSEGVPWNQEIGTGFVNAYGAFNYLDRTDIAITSVTWRDPPILGTDNFIDATVVNNGPNNAQNVYIDFGISRFGIHPNAFTHIGTIHLPSLSDGASQTVSIKYTPTLSIGPITSISLSGARADIRYGGDKNCSNNFDIDPVAVAEPASLLKQADENVPEQNSCNINFEIYNHLFNDVWVKLVEVEKPALVTITYDVSDPSSILVPSVTHPPKNVKATISYPNGIGENIRIEARECNTDTLYGSIDIYLDPTVSVKKSEVSSIPVDFVLEKNYPNPFATETKIYFKVPRNENISLEIYNLLGQRVKTLINKKIISGEKKVSWNGTDGSGRRVAPGIYFYKLCSDRFTKTMKMVLLY